MPHLAAQELWIKECEKKVQLQLRRIDNGEQLVAQVQWILCCERNWVRLSDPCPAAPPLNHLV